MLLGITGTHGSGKGAVTNYLIANHGYKRVAVSDDFLANEAIMRGLEPDRISRKDIANEYRAQGPTALMEAVVERIGGNITSGNVIIDPQHTVAEVEFIQQKGGFVISVDADMKLRYERISRRQSPKDNVSFEEFAKEQRKEMASDDPNKNNLGAAIAAADFHIVNDGTMKELEVQIAEVLKQIEEKALS